MSFSCYCGATRPDDCSCILPGCSVAHCDETASVDLDTDEPVCGHHKDLDLGEPLPPILSTEGGRLKWNLSAVQPINQTARRIP